ncbi:hypothetical protein RUM43_010050 [Polyplax serrata]|uniref:Uncharacterized protein n=1 Tax=Polyplax serrata TaxID=468196 RepID=A0AAN8PKU4_POLSC
MMTVKESKKDDQVDVGEGKKEKEDEGKRKFWRRVGVVATLKCESLKPKKTIGCSDDGTREKEEHDENDEEEEAEEKKSNTTNKKTRTESYETTADIKNLITVGETFITESILRSGNFFTDENLFSREAATVGGRGRRKLDHSTAIPPYDVSSSTKGKPEVIVAQFV